MWMQHDGAPPHYAVQVAGSPPPPKHFKLQNNNRRHKYRRTSLQQEAHPASSDETCDNGEDKGKKEERVSDEENDMPVALDEHKRKRPQPEQTKPLNMSSHGLMTGQTIFSQFGVDTDDFPRSRLPLRPSQSATWTCRTTRRQELSSPTPPSIGPTFLIPRNTRWTSRRRPTSSSKRCGPTTRTPLLDMESHMSGPDHSMDSHDDCDRNLHPGMMMQQDFVGMMPGVSNRLLGKF
ncbi:hypothetical protein NQ317_010567 [Molorchus minor]|uniref:Uncharacterized protein n=1 Tax=Molorchus minor TaxID=1323400 RepID=A0ABQ9JBN6_9CUCU|nr:hypothetical protein NQ317_010567 [Molorchus minor]